VRCKKLLLLLGLGACLQACFMSGYEALRAEAGALSPVGADAGSSLDASVGPGEWPDAGPSPADAGPSPADTGSSSLADAAPRPPECDGGLCPPNLPTTFCMAACELPSCDPGTPCQHRCDHEDSCGTNCQPYRNCVHLCRDSACESICAAGATCDLECRESRSCHITCEPGSTCTAFCQDSNQCSITCKPGARCALRCFAPGAICDFAECGAPVAQCSGATTCSSSGCPPP
jgi:hypothetical protein